MDQFLSQISLTNPEISTVVISLFISFILGSVIAQFYKIVNKGFSYESTFGFTLILITVIVCSIMITIGSNIALSLGLIGALSIIRFRTAIKSTTDMAFIFWSISVGLASGALIYHLAIINVLVIGLIILLMYKAKIFFSNNSRYIFVVELHNDKDIEQVSRLLTKNSLEWNIKSSFSSKERTEITYEIFSKHINTQKILTDIHTLKGIKNVSLLTPETNLYI